MADIELNTYALEQYAGRLRGVNGRLRQLDQDLKSLYFSVGLLGLYRLAYIDCLIGYSSRLARCANALDAAKADFESVERELQRQDPLNFKPPVWAFAGAPMPPINHGAGGGFRGSWKDWIRNLLRNGARFGVAGVTVGAVADGLLMLLRDGELSIESEWSRWSAKTDDDNYLKVLTATASLGAKTGDAGYKNDDYFDKVKIEQDKKSNPSKQVNPDEKWYDKKGTIFSVEEEAKLEGSVVAGKISGKSSWGQGEVESKILTAEGHAKLSGGFYVYDKDENGNVKRIFSPGVEAEVGASVALVQTKAEGRIGLGEDNNMLGVYGNVEGEAFSAEAKAKVAVNKNEIFAGASAEANLAKVSGAAGISVLGTDLGVTGSLKVGVGAHANVGYTDGKLKVDIGAAVGVGFDLGFELDVSGTVDAIKDVASSAWKGAKKLWKGIFG